jgi:hypothetical protein
VETATRQIAEYGYQVTPFGAKRGLMIMTRLLNMIAPALRSVAQSAGDIAAVGELVASLSPDDVVALASDFAESTKVVLPVQSQAGTQYITQPLGPLFDQHFVDRYDELVEFLVFATMTNFGKSIMRGKGLGPKLTEIASPYLSRATSNGSGSGSSPAGATS